MGFRFYLIFPATIKGAFANKCTISLLPIIFHVIKTTIIMNAFVCFRLIQHIYLIGIIVSSITQY